MTPSRPLLSVLLLAVLAFTWGTSFILMKLGMVDAAGNEVFRSNEVAAMRMSFACWAMLPFAFYHLRKIPRTKYLPLLVVGLCGNAIPAFLFTAAETVVAPSLAGMLNSTTPLFTVMIATVVYGATFKRINYIGMVLAIAGSSGLMLANGLDQFYGDVFYSMLILMATFCYAISVNTIRNYLTDLHPIGVTSVSFLFFGIPLSIYLFTTGFVHTLTTHPNGYTSEGYVIILALFGTALAVILFNWLVKITSAVYASTVTYLIPITAIFWGWMRNEPINWMHFVGMGVILAGVYLINKK